jgi:uridylate kinase
MRDNEIPIVVFSIRGRGNLLSVLTGDGVHTTIENPERSKLRA